MVRDMWEAFMESMLYSNHCLHAFWIFCWLCSKTDFPISTWLFVFLPVDCTTLDVLWILALFDSQKQVINTIFSPSLEFRILFPQLTGVLTLAFFIHNCVITLLQNNKNQENNVSNFTRRFWFVYILPGDTIFFLSASLEIDPGTIIVSENANHSCDLIRNHLYTLFTGCQSVTYALWMKPWGESQAYLWSCWH